MTSLIIIYARREDRALLGSNPSARPGAEACREAADPRLPSQPPSLASVCFGSYALNPPCKFPNASDFQLSGVTFGNIFRAKKMF